MLCYVMLFYFILFIYLFIYLFTFFQGGGRRGQSLELLERRIHFVCRFLFFSQFWGAGVVPFEERLS